MRFERESHSIAKVDLELSHVVNTDWLLTTTHRPHDSAPECWESQVRTTMLNILFKSIDF